MDRPAEPGNPTTPVIVAPRLFLAEQPPSRLRLIEYQLVIEHFALKQGQDDLSAERGDGELAAPAAELSS